MAAKDYTLARDTAMRLLTKYGAPAALVTTEITGGDGTPFNPGVETEIENPVHAALVDYTEQERAGTSIQTGDRRALVTADGVTPDTSTVLRFAGTDCQVASISEIGPAGVAVLFDLRVRR